MALTETERIAVERARLDLLLAELEAAQRRKRDGDGNANQSIKDATDALINFQTDTEFPSELAPIAQAAVMSSAGLLADIALDNLAAVAATLSPFGEAFKQARETAKSGKKDLFFPQLAAAAAQLVEVFQAIKETAEKISAEIAAAGGAQNIDDLKDSIGNILDALDALRSEVESAGTV